MKKLAILCLCAVQGAWAFQPNHYACQDKDQVTYSYSESSYRAMPQVVLAMGKLKAEFLGKQIAVSVGEEGSLKVVAKGQQNRDETDRQLVEVVTILEDFELTVESPTQKFDTIATIKIGSFREKPKLVYLKCVALRALY